MPTERSYNHSEFERYIQKQMSPLEMHAFEKAMMSDPFLADALEGYQLSNTGLAKEHLSQISDAIKRGEQRHKKAGIISSAKWLRVAAIFIVIVGAGIITYSILNKPAENTEIASLENKTSIPVDSIGPTNETVAQQSLPGKAANDNTKTTSPVIEENLVRERVSAPIEMAQTNTDTGLSSVGDSAGSLQNAEEKYTLSSARAAKDLSEVAVAGKATSAGRDGWVRFQAYIDKEVGLAKEKNTALAGMKAELEFSVDKNGTIENIKMLNAPNAEVARIATDILHKSPRWTPLANTSRAKIVLNF